MPHLIPYINLLNLSWIIKCLFLRNMAPLRQLLYLIKTNFFHFSLLCNVKVNVFVLVLNMNRNVRKRTFGSSDICRQQIFRLAGIFAHSDQNLHWVHFW